MNRWPKVLMLTAVSCSLVGGYWWYSQNGTHGVNATDTSYKTEQVTHGDIQNSVSATGTLAAVDDVVVGAQLSGQVIKVYADFNDTVEQGQLLAKIDPASFAAKVAQAKALVEKSDADVRAQVHQIERAKLNYERSVRELKRAQGLYQGANISEDAIDTLETQSKQYKLDWQQSYVQLDILKATLAANKANLQETEIELERTDIRAPISGFVINRTIEAGQTVASSYNTPELFTLAKSLSEMEIEAYIDESDIGLVQEGQQVSFTVDAFSSKKFRGEVNQIRKAPQNNSGVVSYIVVMSTRNPDNILLPGMTANMEVEIENMRDVQRVSNTAVRMGSRYAVSDSNEAKGPLSRLKYLDLSQQQVDEIYQSLAENNIDPKSRIDRKQRQQVQKLIAKALTPEQRELQKKIRKGEVKMGPLMVLRDGKIVTVQAQFGVSDDKNTAVIAPDLSNDLVINQYREKR
ncbi:efflux RND transporter periplasmic adaptor subunit [Vibrio hippocampi]|uniref:Multidrug resistance protein MdtA n=1 Tax=Vibrio hippocampi TaxID=654686 RepID=A0ABM8ZP22_9VIBR|nr:efflux RND transporter periplasmic adaptor subunit [Vibrio hippocampi]CAH0530080.1 Multidrug resistance protein MdtA [Vibrio hippocampi]